jgi:hypothetical protein
VGIWDLKRGCGSLLTLFVALSHFIYFYLISFLSFFLPIFISRIFFFFYYIVLRKVVILYFFLGDEGMMENTWVLQGFSKTCCFFGHIHN